MSTLRTIFAGESDINFRPKWRIALLISITLLIVSAVLLSTRGLNMSIDFEGGAVWEVPVEGVTVAEARALPGLDDATIQVVGGSGSDVLRVQAGTEAVDQSDEIASRLAELVGVTPDAVSYTHLTLPTTPYV